MMNLRKADLNKVIFIKFQVIICTGTIFAGQDNSIFPQPRTTRSFRLQAFSIVHMLTQLQNTLTIHTYNPQGIKPCSAICKPKVKNLSVYGKSTIHDYIQTATGYPTNLLEIRGINIGAGRLHPTQKPVELDKDYFEIERDRIEKIIQL